MGQADIPPWYDRLNDNQKEALNAIRDRIYSSGPGPLDTNTGDQVIETLASWLMDDEQKQNLEANGWDIFFLHAAASLLSLKNADGAKHSAESTLPEDLSEASLVTEAAHTFWPSLELADEQQANILGLIGKGYLAASSMAEEVPPGVAYDSENTVNIQFLSACLRLAVGFNLAAPETLKHLRNLLPPAAAVNKDFALERHYTVVSTGAHPHVQATVLVPGC